MQKKGKIVLAICLMVLLLLGAGCGVYLSDYYHANDAALAAMADALPQVRVVAKDNVTFFVPEEPRAGMIFYPGGKVQCEAYASLMQMCAERGMLCALVKMPGNLAVFKPNAADGIQEMYPEIQSWYIAGHSLGGAMAATYASSHADTLDGLILLAAYASNDISGSGLKVLSIYGSEDGVLNREKYAANQSNLPKDYEEHVLEGGCHAYFGSYGAQKGDGMPAITAQEQMWQTAELIETFIEREE